MFQVPEGKANEKLVSSVEKNYIIQANDLLSLQVYTNKGERLIDPDNQLAQEKTPRPNETGPERPQYLVNHEGKANLPMVGEIRLDGMSLQQAEEILAREFGRFYEEPFVRVRFENKRVIVLGAPGGMVIPLTNEKVSLVEILALAKGVTNEARANNIRVIRGEQVLVADLSTFEGYTKHNITMEPGDIVYVEPVRRPFVESARDYGPLLGVIVSIGTLIAVLAGL